MTKDSTSSAAAGACDDHLLRLCAAFQRHTAEAAAASDDDRDEAVELALDARWQAAHAMQAMEPVTLEGLRAKAAAAVLLIAERHFDEPADDAAEFALSVLRNVVAIQPL